MTISNPGVYVFAGFLIVSAVALVVFSLATAGARTPRFWRSRR